MFVNTNQLQIGIINFIENEIARKAVGFQKFATYFVMPSIPKKIQDYVNSLASNAMFEEYFDENRNVNVDLLYNNAKQAVAKSGQFTAFGVILGETDITRMYEYIRSATA